MSPVSTAAEFKNTPENTGRGEILRNEMSLSALAFIAGLAADAVQYRVFQ
ncbi:MULTISPECIES: hypothetical protein [unclassified Rhizobium]|nr:MULTISPECIES: hypothetical protein [unclassified Rhizobium]MBX5167706.1 hypothetical protein [Rhizobium sp. NZLR4b]MBX5188547.1 hypothetical protein [Rhizobium sp. NZLR3b]MBX5211757.1 hypothetical protein [Rhizobium sp. NZLR11]